MKLDGKIAVITGADGGIGQATAEAFAREGAHVAVSYPPDVDGADDVTGQTWAMDGGPTMNWGGA